ncbi:MAG: M20/M25/M40 family metallo-hydrolase [Planctomycetota bacterium]
MLELLKELIFEHGITGYESGIRKLIESKLPRQFPKHIDNMGNMIVEAGAGEPEVIFAAHMDELGMIVSEIREDGFLHIRNLMDIDPRIMLGRVLRIKTKKGEVKGVVGLKPIHLMSEDRYERHREMSQIVLAENMFVDIGADSAEEAHSLGVEILDPVTFEKNFEVLNSKYVTSRGLDNRAGCTVLLEAINTVSKLKKMKGKAFFAFTVQEERTMRGANLVALNYKDVKRAFIIDTSSSGLIPSGARSKGPGKLGNGPAFRCVDETFIADQEFVKEIRQIAEKKKIPSQLIFTGGRTDAEPFDMHGPKTLPITIPVRYTHSPAEVVSLKDIENTSKLIYAIVEHYCG